MLAKAQKWGNSLAVRIPKTIAEECGIGVDSALEILREGENMIIRPVREKLSLESLLEKVTEDNLHAEVTSGAPVGKEAW
jgi:antitoxin MazE